MDREQDWGTSSDREDDPFTGRFGLPHHTTMMQTTRNRRYSHFSLDKNDEESEFIESEEESDQLNNHGCTMAMESQKAEQSPGPDVTEGFRDEADPKLKFERDEGQSFLENSNNLSTRLLAPLRPRIMAVKYQGSTAITTPVMLNNHHKFLVVRDSRSELATLVRASVTLANFRLSGSQRAQGTRNHPQASMKRVELQEVPVQDKLMADQLDDQRSTDMPTQTAKKLSARKKSNLKQLQASPSSDDSIMVADPCDLQTPSRRHHDRRVSFQPQDRLPTQTGSKLAAGKTSKRMQPTRSGDNMTFLGKRMTGGSDSTQSAPASTTEVTTNTPQTALAPQNMPQMRVVESQLPAKIMEHYPRPNMPLRRVEVPVPEVRLDDAWKHLWKNHQDRKLKSKLDDLIAYWSQANDRQTPILFKSLSKEVSTTGVKVTKTVDLSKRKLSMSVVAGKHVAPLAIQKEATAATQLKNGAKAKRNQPPRLQPQHKPPMEHHTSGLLAGFVKIAPGPVRQETAVPKREQQALFHLRNITAEPEDAEI